MNSKKFGYIRVSSKDQNEGRQLESMKAKGIEDREIFMDKQSGKDFNRAKYQALNLNSGWQQLSGPANFNHCK